MNRPRFPRPVVVWRRFELCMTCGGYSGWQSSTRPGEPLPRVCRDCGGAVAVTVTRYPARPGCKPRATIRSAMRVRTRRRPYLPFRPVVGGHITRPADPARKGETCPVAAPAGR